MTGQWFRQLMLAALTVPALATLSGADTGKPVAVCWWGQAMVSIETYWNLKIVIDPYDAGRTGYVDPGIAADVVLVTHEHFDHNNVKLVKGKPAVVRGLDPGGEVRPVHLVLDRPANTAKPALTEASSVPETSRHAVRIQSVPSHHDQASGRKRGHIRDVSDRGRWRSDSALR